MQRRKQQPSNGDDQAAEPRDQAMLDPVDAPLEPLGSEIGLPLDPIDAAFELLEAQVEALLQLAQIGLDRHVVVNGFVDFGRNPLRGRALQAAALERPGRGQPIAHDPTASLVGPQMLAIVWYDTSTPRSAIVTLIAIQVPAFRRLQASISGENSIPPRTAVPEIYQPSVQPQKGQGGG